MSGASERANGRASGPVLQSVFLVILAHCVVRDVSNVEIEVAAFPAQTLKLCESVVFLVLINTRIGDIF